MNRPLEIPILLLLILIFLYFSTLGAATSENVVNNNYYSEKEIGAIEKFREMVGSSLYQNYMKMDEYLIRWIKDADFDLNAAKHKLLKAIEWRKKNNIDGVLQEDFSSLLRQCPYSVKGRDKIGRPVATLNYGTCDIRKIVLAGDLSRLQRLMYYCLELPTSTVRQLSKTGMNITDGILIVDANGFNLKQHACLRCMSVGAFMLEAYQSYYPNFLHKAFFINVPRIALPFVDLAIPLLSPRSRETFKVFGYDRNEWEPEIRKLIDPRQIPYQFGGLKKQELIN